MTCDEQAVEFPTCFLSGRNHFPVGSREPFRNKLSLTTGGCQSAVRREALFSVCFCVSVIDVGYDAKSRRVCSSVTGRHVRAEMCVSVHACY